MFSRLVLQASAREDTTESLENVTKTIGNLLEGYDIRLRPNFGGRSGIQLNKT